MKSFQELALSRWRFGTYLFTKLPLAWFAGISVRTFSEMECVLAMRHQWINQNPFGSIYFAALLMAGEMASGLLAMKAITEGTPAVSILVVRLESEFTKKARGLVLFRCADGHLLQNSVLKARETGNPVTAASKTVATDEAGDIVARFTITWSFKTKSDAAA